MHIPPSCIFFFHFFLSCAFQVAYLSVAYNSNFVSDFTKSLTSFLLILLRHIPFLRRRLIFFLLFSSPSSFLLVIIRFSSCLFFYLLLLYSLSVFLFISFFFLSFSVFFVFTRKQWKRFSACVDTTLVTTSHICVEFYYYSFDSWRVSTDILDRKVFGTSEDIASEEKEIKNGKKYETKNSKN